jgi:hypothetical protein
MVLIRNWNVRNVGYYWSLQAEIKWKLNLIICTTDRSTWREVTKLANWFNNRYPDGVWNCAFVLRPYTVLPWALRSREPWSWISGWLNSKMMMTDLYDITFYNKLMLWLPVDNKIVLQTWPVKVYRHNMFFEIKKTPKI